MENEQAFGQRIKSSLKNVEASMKRLRRVNLALIISSVFGSAVSTLVAGVAATQGEPLIGAGTAGWRTTCVIAAVSSFVAALSVGLNQQLRLEERLVNRRQCAGQLQSLEVTMTTGRQNWDKIVEEYQEIVRTYPHLMKQDLD